MPKITINGISINPDAQQAQPSFSALMAPDSSESNYVLVQIDGPLNRERRQAMADLGVKILEYVPENTYICYYPPSNLDAIRALPFVQWANIYLEGFKIQTQLRTEAPTPGVSDLLTLGEVPTSMSQEPKHVVVVLHKDVDPEEVRDAIARAARLDPEGLQFSHNAVRLTVQPQDLEDLAQIDAVRHIEEYAPPKLLNHVALGILRADEVHTSTHLEGEGEVIAICDTGFDRGSLNDTHPAFAGRVCKIYALGRAMANDPHGHGTHVAGSALGDGQSTSMDSHIRGTAPKALLIMQSVLDSMGGLGGLPDDLTDLFRAPYEEEGARVHTNSWGVRSAAWFGRYTANSEQIDRFVWDHRDCVICFAAGNEGRDQNADGVVDLGSVTPPGTAKNCITVGASENNRPQGSKSYGGPWWLDFPVDPLASDNWANNPEGMAAFSSRGPTQNGRIKPDVIAPGTAILSAHSRDAHVGSFWGTSSDALYAFMGGTSMATPLVAGCAAVIREYFQKERGHQPSAALVKAMLINGARDLVGQYVPSEAGGLPNLSEGFGRVDLAMTVGPYTADTNLITRDENTRLDTGESEQLDVSLPAAGANLKATLVWTDPPGEALQNDLDLIVREANGQERHGNMPASSAGFDRNNNVEQVSWENLPVGDVQVIVRAQRVTLHPQSYALVVRVAGGHGTNGHIVLENVALDISGVQLSLDGINRLAAQVSFQLTGSDAQALAATRARFRVTANLVDRMRNTEPREVATQEGTLQPETAVYNSRLLFPMPAVGRYQLISRVVVTVSGEEDLLAEDDSVLFRVSH